MVRGRDESRGGGAAVLRFRHGEGEVRGRGRGATFEERFHVPVDGAAGDGGVQRGAAGLAGDFGRRAVNGDPDAVAGRAADGGPAEIDARRSGRVVRGGEERRCSVTGAWIVLRDG